MEPLQLNCHCYLDVVEDFVSFSLVPTRRYYRLLFVQLLICPTILLREPHHTLESVFGQHNVETLLSNTRYYCFFDDFPVFEKQVCVVVT